MEIIIIMFHGQKRLLYTHFIRLHNIIIIYFLEIMPKIIHFIYIFYTYIIHYIGVTLM